MQECLEIRRDFDGDVPLRIKIGERSWQLAGGEKVSLILAIPVRVFRLSRVRAAMLHDKPVATSVVANPGICLSPIPDA